MPAMREVRIMWTRSRSLDPAIFWRTQNIIMVTLNNLDFVSSEQSNIGILSLDWLTRPALHGKLHRYWIP